MLNKLQILFICVIAISSENSYGLSNINKQNKSTIQSSISHGLPYDLPQIIANPVNGDSGLYFLGNSTNDVSDSFSKFIIISDNNGNPFYYKRVPYISDDFKLQPNGLMTYCVGDSNANNRKFFALDSNFDLTDSFYVKGYVTDIHDIQLLPNGHILLIGMDSVNYDMSNIIDGGDSDAVLFSNVIQEQDENRNVVFEWHAIDHISVTDATEDIDLTANTIDFCHMNAIEMDNDGNILASCRNLDEILKINRQTGEIIWQWGGINNQFQFINDSVGFSHQHTIRRLNNGNLCLFDDGNLHWDVLPSRAVEYKMDEINKTVELVWQFQHDPPIESDIMGNIQYLNNGNKVIGWGSGYPAITELDVSGNVINELALLDDQINYRAMKFVLPASYYSAFISKPLYPTNNSYILTDSVLLVWSRNKFAQSFYLQVATDAGFKNLIVNDSNLTGTEYILNLGLLTGDNIYYWRVWSYNNGRDEGGYSNWSEVFSFIKTITSSINQDDNKLNFALYQNYPNPATNTTIINYLIPDNNYVSLVVYNELGVEISHLVNSYQSAGMHNIELNTENIPTGIYCYTLKSGDNILTKNMLVIK
jgi:Arylsulfotransferase (ASST)/Secretion system C-terminal sorting domain